MCLSYEYNYYDKCAELIHLEKYQYTFNQQIIHYYNANVNRFI